MYFFSPADPALLARIPQMSPHERAELAVSRGQPWPVWELLITDPDAWVRRIARRQMQLQLWRAHYPDQPFPFDD